MNKILNFGIVALLILGTSCSFAQDDKSKRKSPPAKATGQIGNATVTIDYSQPSVKGRKLWGDLVPFDAIWRTGANEATTFETSADLMVEGKELKAGKYSLFSIPSESNEWVIIFNKVHEQWGAYKYDEAEDALRVNVKAQKSKKSVEMLTFSVKSDMVGFMWGDLQVPFKVSVK